MAIKGYHTQNGIFNSSEFMEKLLKNNKNIRFIEAGASHINGAEERTITMADNMERTTLMRTALICIKEMFQMILDNNNGL